MFAKSMDKNIPTLETLVIDHFLYPSVGLLLNVNPVVLTEAEAETNKPTVTCVVLSWEIFWIILTLCKYKNQKVFEKSERMLSNVHRTYTSIGTAQTYIYILLTCT